MDAESPRGRSRSFGAPLSSWGALALPLLAVACLGLLLVPPPPALVDLLLALSLGGSLWLLALALGAPARESLAFLPHSLMLLTLFRLCLNVGTTRLILGRGEAGAVIEAFGSFVVGGSYLVGGVVFAILSLVQFLVIARGSSRVAEVTARFSLDGLPGRQRAIDADLAQRVIDGGEATRRRAALERESRLHGGLDGAMRFVRGDALAGLAITAVNLLGGVAIGVSQRGMGLDAALQRFGLLTIGDGLAAQIPALLTATATGLVATRAASADPDARPGAELAQQLLTRPGLLGMVALLLLLLAAVPGLPAGPFVAVAGLLGALALVGRRVAPEEPPALLEPSSQPRLVLELGDLLREACPSRRAEPALRKALGALSEQQGVPVPLPSLRPLSGSLPPTLDPCRAARLCLDGQELAHWDMDPGDPELPEVLAERVLRALRPVVAELLGVAETRRLLDRIGAREPELLRAVLPERLDLQAVTAVLRGMLRGGLPIAPLRPLVEELAALPCGVTEPGAALERLRAARPRAVSRALAGDAPQLEVWIVGSLVEEALRDARRGAAEATLRLDRDLLEELRCALQACQAPEPPADPLADPRPILLTQADLRAPLEAALAGRARVVASRELDPELAVEPLGVFGPGS